MVDNENPSFRTVALAYLGWMENVKGAKPSTLRDHRSVLGEPDLDYKRGSAKTNGHVMRAIGERPAAAVTTRDVEGLLARVAKGGAGPRTCNKFRSVISAVYTYGQRQSTFALPGNPVTETTKRKVPHREPLDFYAVPEIEAIASACTDAQDGEIVRVAAYAGLREARYSRCSGVTSTSGTRC